MNAWSSACPRSRPCLIRVYLPIALCLAAASAPDASASVAPPVYVSVVQLEHRTLAIQARYELTQSFSKSDPHGEEVYGDFFVQVDEPYFTYLRIRCRLTGQEPGDFSPDAHARFLARPHMNELSATPYAVLLEAGITAANRGTLPLERWVSEVRALDGRKAGAGRAEQHRSA